MKKNKIIHEKNNQMLKLQMGNKKIKMLLYVAVALCVLSPGSVSAADIAVVFGRDFPITEKNIAPGQTFERFFTVTNTSTSSQAVMIRFDDQSGFRSWGSVNVEDMIFVQIERPDGTLATMPNNNTDESLKDLFAFNDAFVFDTLSATDNSPKDYKLIFTFSKDAGNEYQNKKTVFDTSIGINSLEVAPGSNSQSGSGDSSGTESGSNSSGNVGSSSVVGSSSTGGSSSSDDDDNNDNDGNNNNRDNNPGATLAAASFNQAGPGGIGTPDGDQGTAPVEEGTETVSGEVAGEQVQGEEITEAKNYWKYPWILLVIALLARLGYLFLGKFNKKYNLKP